MFRGQFQILLVHEKSWRLHFRLALFYCYFPYGKTELLRLWRPVTTEVPQNSSWPYPQSWHHNHNKFTATIVQPNIYVWKLLSIPCLVRTVPSSTATCVRAWMHSANWRTAGWGRSLLQYRREAQTKQSPIASVKTVERWIVRGGGRKIQLYP